jgi:anti-anti-sigma factor
VIGAELPDGQARVAVHTTDTETRIALAGEFDVLGADAITEVIEDLVDVRPEVVFHLGGVTFFGSAGLRALLHLVRHTRELGGAVRCDPDIPRNVQRVVEIIGAEAELGFPARPSDPS